jgi:hypothetical protein
MGKPIRQRPKLQAVNTQNREFIVNALTRSINTMFAGYFGGDAKHDRLYSDFGWPQAITFANYYQMYQRNGLAYAAIIRPIETCWQEYPELLEKEDTHDKTPLEKQIAERFEEINFWSVLAKADEYSRIGEYAGVIFRFADGKTLDQPVDSKSLGLNGLVEVVPAMQGQLKPSERFSDPADTANFGKVKMWQYNENGIIDGAENARMDNSMIHPDRVHVWSMNSSIFGKPVLEACFNDLLTLQKISGAGGEGFWKNAKANPIIQFGKDASMQKIAQALGAVNGAGQADPALIADKLDEVIGDWQTGLDNTFALQDGEAKFNSIRMDDPEPHRLGALQSVAAAISCPLKILIGTQTGERASTEDAKEWNKTCNSRNTKMVKPNIRRIIRNKLVKYGVLPAMDWYLLWSDLTESSTTEKFDIAGKMADINAKNRGAGEPVTYTANEIRETTGWDAMVEEKVPRRGPAADENTDRDNQED